MTDRLSEIEDAYCFQSSIEARDINWLITYVRKAEAELVALRADTARLDYLEEYYSSVSRAPCTREKIDEEMEE